MLFFWKTHKPSVAVTDLQNRNCWMLIITPWRWHSRAVLLGFSLCKKLHIVHCSSEQFKLISVRSTSFPNYSQWFTCVPGSQRRSDTISLISRDKWLPPSPPHFLHWCKLNRAPPPFTGAHSPTVRDVAPVAANKGVVGRTVSSV